MSRNQSDAGHRPVMPAEVAELLITDRRGAYLDLTAGGGGHMLALAERLAEDARVYGIDRDAEAVARVKQRLTGTAVSVRVAQAAFADVAEVADRFGEKSYAGILLDLGLSSYQLDDPGRGFSFRHDSALDMRFDPNTGISAAELLATTDQRELTRILAEYGEVKQAGRVAREIVRERQQVQITRTAQLADIVLRTIPSPQQHKTLARVFQALRIAVNREMEQLEQVLPGARDLLGAGGRLAVISYHSLEDRMVKRFLQAEARGRCTCPPGLPECVCGARPTVKVITRKPVTPGEAEVAANPRARSAKLRVAERID